MVARPWQSISYRYSYLERKALDDASRYAICAGFLSRVTPVLRKLRRRRRRRIRRLEAAKEAKDKEKEKAAKATSSALGKRRMADIDACSTDVAATDDTDIPIDQAFEGFLMDAGGNAPMAVGGNVR